MQNSNSIAVCMTSINPPPISILLTWIDFLKKKNLKFRIFVAGDLKTPEELYSDLPQEIEFLSFKTQETRWPALSAILGHSTYSRKNFAYLAAVEQGYDYIWESDDDTFPSNPKFNPFGEASHYIDCDGYINPFSVYGVPFQIWPRGIPLESVLNPAEYELSNLKTEDRWDVLQTLVNGEPDVDAIFRLTVNPNVIQLPDTGNVYLIRTGKMPGNTQSTIWKISNSIQWLFTPRGLSFRSCDIWKIYIAQRFLKLGLASAVTTQHRNPHNLLTDFEQEIPVYLLTDELNRSLSAMESHLDILSVYNRLHKDKLVTHEDCTAAGEWLRIISVMQCT